MARVQLTLAGVPPIPCHTASTPVRWCGTRGENVDIDYGMLKQALRDVLDEGTDPGAELAERGDGVDARNTSPALLWTVP